jgi:glutaredoxin
MSKTSKIHITYLYGCPYSEKAEGTLIENKISFNINKINRNETEAYKQKYNFPTFPHITLKNKKDDIIYTIGGCNDLIEFITVFRENPLDKNKVDIYCQKYNTTKHNILRTIHIINNIK